MSYSEAPSCKTVPRPDVKFPVDVPRDYCPINSRPMLDTVISNTQINYVLFEDDSMLIAVGPCSPTRMNGWEMCHSAYSPNRSSYYIRTRTRRYGKDQEAGILLTVLSMHLLSCRSSGREQHQNGSFQPRPDPGSGRLSSPGHGT